MPRHDDPQAAAADPDRLAALEATGLLDTPPEEDFDRFTRLASRLVGAPVVLLSLVDRDRQFFKSQQGLSGWAAADRETPLSHSFCKHVVQSDEPLVVSDARSDPLLVENLAIRDLGVIAYAGMPVRSTEGDVLGSFCAIHPEPHEWTEEELALLEDIAQAAVAEIRLRAAAEAERSARERLQAIFDGAGEGIALLDAAGRFVETNPAFLRITGYRREELEGRSLSDLAHPDDAAEGRTRRKMLVAGEVEQLRFRMRYVNRDGDVVHARVTLTRQGAPSESAGDGADGSLRLVAILEDVTERHRAETALREREASFRQIVENASDLIYRTDREGRFVYANPTARRLVGYDMDELRGMSWRDLVRPDHLEDVEAFYEEQVRSRTPSSRLELPLMSRSGQEVWVEQHVHLLFRDDRLEGAQAVARDVTGRREIDRMKNEFVSVVSHELRTPLTSIRGALGLLAGGVLGELPEKGRRMVEVASQNTDRLVRLINDILDLERLESGRTEFEPRTEDARTLVTEAVEAMEGMATEAGVELRTDLPGDATPVWADRDRIVQTLTNLVSNAVKFSEEGAAVTVRVSEAGPKGARFEVEDRGRGIPADKIGLIFERFQQVDASDSREKGGTGLGLAICKSIVEAHGGEIAVASEPGEGTTFSFTIPDESGRTVSVSSPRTVSPSPVSPTPTAPTVLICDDDSGVREVLARILTARGYRAATAADGEEALRMARTLRPRLVLLDLAMPGMTGWEVLEALEADVSTRRIPVIIHSGSEPPADLPHEVAGWLVKAVDHDVLGDAVERVLGSSGADVLVVEDDPGLADVLAHALEERGMAPRVAPSGRRAMELARESPPDLVVLDLHIPEGDGFQVLRRFREDPTLEGVPVLVYTAAELAREEREALDVPSGRILTKSRVPLGTLVDRIDGILTGDGGESGDD